MNILEAARLGQGMGGGSSPMAIAGNNASLRSLPVPQVANTINAQPASLQEMDKIRYQEQMKENLRQQQFNALNSAMAEDRVFADQMALNDQAHAQRLIEEDMRAQNVLQAQVEADNKARARLKDERQIKLADERLDQIAKDRRYAGIAKSAKRVIADAMNWNDPANPNGRDAFIRTRERDLIDRQAMSKVTPEVIEQYFANNQEFAGTQVPQYGSEEYKRLARALFAQTPDGQAFIQSANTQALREGMQITQTKMGAYNQMLSLMQKFGFSMPDLDVGGSGMGSNYGLNGGLMIDGGNMRIDDLNALPALSGKTKATGGEAKSNVDPNALALNLYTGQLGKVTGLGKSFFTDPETGEFDGPGSLGSNTALAGTAYAYDRFSRPSTDALNKGILDKGGLNRPQGDARKKGQDGKFTQKADKAYSKHKVKVVRSVEKKLGLNLKDISDKDLGKKSLTELREIMEKGRQGKIEALFRKYGGKAAKSGKFKGAMKLTGYLTAGMLIKDLIDTIPAEEKAEAVAEADKIDQDFITASNQLTEEGSAGGVNYRIIE